MSSFDVEFMSSYVECVEAGALRRACVPHVCHCVSGDLHLPSIYMNMHHVKYRKTSRDVLHFFTYVKFYILHFTFHVDVKLRSCFTVKS